MSLKEKILNNNKQNKLNVNNNNNFFDDILDKSKSKLPNFQPNFSSQRINEFEKKKKKKVISKEETKKEKIDEEDFNNNEINNLWIDIEEELQEDHFEAIINKNKKISFDPEGYEIFFPEEEEENFCINCDSISEKEGIDYPSEGEDENSFSSNDF